MTDPTQFPREEWEPVPNPIADHLGGLVPRWQARILAEEIPEHILIWRSAAALLSGNWEAGQLALDEMPPDRLATIVQVAVKQLCLSAIDGAHGDKTAAADYFEQLIFKQLQMPGEREV